MANEYLLAVYSFFVRAGRQILIWIRTMFYIYKGLTAGVPFTYVN